ADPFDLANAGAWLRRCSHGTFTVRGRASSPAFAFLAGYNCVVLGWAPASAGVPSGRGPMARFCGIPARRGRRCGRLGTGAARGGALAMGATTRPDSTHACATLPAAYYTDPAIFDREIERFFAGRWFAAGRALELAAPGDYVLREMAGESLIVLRDEAGS